MKSYIMQIVACAIVAVFADILSPKGWGKYVAIITGIFLFSCILSPLARWKNIDTVFDYEQQKSDYSDEGNEIYKNMLEMEFSKNVSMDVKEKIRQEFLKDVEVWTEIEISEEGEIEKIKKITIKGENITEDIKRRISYIYNVDEVVIGEF